MMPKMIPLEERFRLKLVIPDDPDACWGWNGATDEKGYGRIGRGGRGNGVCIASRVSYEVHIGAIPDGLAVLHTCDNPPCTNPRHLFVGTNLDNVRDMMAKGRHEHGAFPSGDMNPARRYPDRLMRGESLHLSRLTENDVRAIRAAWDAAERKYGMLSKLARQYGVAPSSIQRIVERQTWHHVP